MAAAEYDLFMRMPVRVRERIIALEVERDWKHSEELDYFGSWDANLPNGNHRQVCDEGNITDIPFGTWMSPKDKHNHSPLLLQQTPRQFFEAIDQALALRGIPVSEIEQIQSSASDRWEAFVKSNKQLDLMQYRAELLRLHSLLLPAYEELRVAGYTYADLTGEFFPRPI